MSRLVSTIALTDDGIAALHMGQPCRKPRQRAIDQLSSRISRDPAAPESRESYLVHLKDNRGIQKILPETLPHFDLSLKGFQRIAIQLCTILQQSIILVLGRDKRR